MTTSPKIGRIIASFSTFSDVRERMTDTRYGSENDRHPLWQ